VYLGNVPRGNLIGEEPRLIESWTMVLWLGSILWSIVKGVVGLLCWIILIWVIVGGFGWGGVE
jgi:hypothetical protein